MAIKITDLFEMITADAVCRLRKVQKIYEKLRCNHEYTDRHYFSIGNKILESRGSEKQCWKCGKEAVEERVDL